MCLSELRWSHFLLQRATPVCEFLPLQRREGALGREAVPFVRLYDVLRDAATAGIAIAKIGLGRCAACPCSAALRYRNNRVIRVERRLKIGTASRLNDALLESEDSESLNTSFIERLNLTIRQGSAYLRRRSTAHARCEDTPRLGSSN